MDLLCPWEPAKFFILSSNVPTLLYYSHFLSVLFALIFLFILLSQKNKNSSTYLLMSVLGLFSVWSIVDVLLWATNRPDLVIFYWSLQILFEAVLYLNAYYLSWSFLNKNAMPFSLRFGTSIFLIPIIILLPTNLLLTGVDIAYCNAIETNFAVFYSYGFQILMSFMILFVVFKKIHSDKKSLLETVSFGFGIILFLIAFSSGNIIGSITDNWVLAQIGLFGMPIFIGFLMYMVVRFKTFSIKIIGTQAIVVVLWVMTLSVLFVRNIENVRYIIIFTLSLFTILGYQLVKSVRREIESREKIEQLAKNLQKANDRLLELDKQKSEFVSFATHQLRAPLTAMKGYASMILEGDIGKLDPETKDAVERIMDSSSTLATVVDDYLNISRIELGTMKYNFTKMPLHDIVYEVIAELRPNIDKSGLAFEYIPDQNAMESLVNTDEDKMKQVIGNIIDNTTKYTKTGGIKVYLKKVGSNLRFMTEDTGIGIAREVMPKLFEKFSRGLNGNRANIHGTGLGLFVAKEIVGAHKGKIWAESEGEGKGSRFYVELPIVG